MIGSIIGDIIGSTYEGNPTKNYNFELFTPGMTFTDDSVLTIAVADALLHQKPFDKTIHQWENKYQTVVTDLISVFGYPILIRNPITAMEMALLCVLVRLTCFLTHSNKF